MRTVHALVKPSSITRTLTESIQSNKLDLQQSFMEWQDCLNSMEVIGAYQDLRKTGDISYSTITHLRDLGFGESISELATITEERYTDKTYQDDFHTQLDMGIKDIFKKIQKTLKEVKEKVSIQIKTVLSMLEQISKKEYFFSECKKVNWKQFNKEEHGEVLLKKDTVKLKTLIEMFDIMRKMDFKSLLIDFSDVDSWFKAVDKLRPLVQRFDMKIPDSGYGVQTSFGTNWSLFKGSMIPAKTSYFESDIYGHEVEVIDTMLSGINDVIINSFYPLMEEFNGTFTIIYEEKIRDRSLSIRENLKVQKIYQVTFELIAHTHMELERILRYHCVPYELLFVDLLKKAVK
ncbi:MAG: hypothetical protein GY804_08905 [Alphaproteobacteria bacterium]|nr:hypothetical protein [Alphaproteobacteria bacterium]